VAGGYLREDFEGTEFAIFSPGDPISVHDARPIVVSRLGIEFTGVNVRVTPIVEIVASPGAEHRRGSRPRYRIRVVT